MWQRVFSGLLCVGTGLALSVNAIHGSYHGWHSVTAILAAAGAYVFGCIALRGRLPGKLVGTEYVRLRRTSDRRNA